MAKKILHTKALVVKKDIGKDGVIDAIVGSTPVIDRMGDSIDQGGWDLKNFKANPVILWGHNSGLGAARPPIGKALKVWVKDKRTKSAKLMFKVKFDLLDNFAAEVFRKIKDGFLNTVSVGFMPKEWEPLDDTDGPFSPRKYTKQELLELSFVPVPANPEAVVALKGMKDKRFAPIELDKVFLSKKKTKVTEPDTVIKVSIDDKKLSKKEKIKIARKAVREVEKEVQSKKKKPKKKIFVSKKVIRYKDLGTLPDSETWDGPGEQVKAQVEDLKLICAWYDDEKAEDKVSYKLPHHKAVGHKAVWRGVTASMAFLLGAKNGLTVPEADRKGVYNHLKKHYKQFDKPVPSFNLVEDQILATLEQEIHSLALNREDTHVIRLVKKVIDRQKQEKKVKEITKRTTGVTEAQTASALRLINLALSSYKIDSNKHGGEQSG